MVSDILSRQTSPKRGDEHGPAADRSFDFRLQLTSETRERCASIPAAGKGVQDRKRLRISHGGNRENCQRNGQWNERLSFEGSSDGGFPFGGLLMDQQGNLYGSTTEGPGGSNGGTVYELQPSGDSWTYRTLTALSGDGGPADAPTMDAAGNLYFTSNADGTLGFGNVFKLTPSGSTWVYTDLHDFNANDGGYYPSGSVALDAQGNLYGTTPETSSSRWGEIWKLTP